MSKIESLNELRRRSHASLQQVITTCQAAERTLGDFDLPVTPELQAQIQQHWHQQFCAWNDYAAFTRRLATLLQQIQAQQ